MWSTNTQTRQVGEFYGTIPDYAILSHTWHKKSQSPLRLSRTLDLELFGTNWETSVYYRGSALHIHLHRVRLPNDSKAQATKPLLGPTAWKSGFQAPSIKRG